MPKLIFVIQTGFRIPVLRTKSSIVLSVRVVLGALFLLLVTSIIVLGMIAFQYNEKTISTSNQVTNTYQVIEKADEISSAFQTLQLESNAIYIKKDTARSQHYKAARSALFSQLSELRKLTGDNPSEQERVTFLEEELKKLVAFSDSAFSYAGTTDRSVKERTDRNIAFRESILGMLAETREVELELLQRGTEANKASIVAFQNIFIQLLAVTGILIVATFLSTRYNINRLIRIEEQLKKAQKETEKALASEVELNRLKTDFVSIASHEFRTPLTTVLSSTYLLETYTSGVNDQKVARHLARIRSSVNNLTSILDDFLSITKIEEGKVKPNIEQLNIKEYIANCCANLQGFVKSGQSIVFEHSGGDEAKTDPVLVGNIINNLVTNSIKYSGENTSILVSCRVNEKIHLLVKDKGIGIPKSDQKNLFSRFYRASNAGAVQGTGLGLHIMKRYVEILNGSIKVTSAEGKGTEIEVTLEQLPIT